MSSESRMTVAVERVTFTTGRAFDDVVESLYRGIGQPDLAALMPRLRAARTFDEYTAMVQDAVGSSGLMRFLHLDQGDALAKNPATPGLRLVRIVAGNPVTMSKMARYVPDAGSYAPVTILVYEGSDGVHVCYDTAVSVLRPYGDDRALEVAEELDGDVLALLRAATDESAATA